MNTLDLIVFGGSTLAIFIYVYLGIGLSRGDRRVDTKRANGG